MSCGEIRPVLRRLVGKSYYKQVISLSQRLVSVAAKQRGISQKTREKVLILIKYSLPTDSTQMPNTSQAELTNTSQAELTNTSQAELTNNGYENREKSLNVNVG